MTPTPPRDEAVPTASARASSSPMPPLPDDATTLRIAVPRGISSAASPSAIHAHDDHDPSNTPPSTADSFSTLIHRQPCFRSSLLYAISAGLGAGALRYWRRPNVLAASNAAVFVICGVAAVSWPLCVRRRIEQQRKGVGFLEALRQARETSDTSALRRLDVEGVLDESRE